MHFICSYLDFKRLSLRSYKCCMKRLIIVRFRHGNIIFKMPRNRLIYLMNNTKRSITVPLGIYNDSYGKKVINLLKLFVLCYHFFVYAEIMFCSSVNSCLYAGGFYMLVNFCNNLFYKFFTSDSSLVKSCHKIVVYLRFKVSECQIVKFYLNFRYT